MKAKLRCKKHSKPFKYFCPYPCYQTYLCENCKDDPQSQYDGSMLLGVDQFADYVLRRLDKRQRDIDNSLSSRRYSEKFGYGMISEHAKALKKLAVNLIDYVKEMTIEVEGILKSLMNVSSKILKNIERDNKNTDLEAINKENKKLNKLKEEVLKAKKEAHFLFVRKAWENFNNNPYELNINNDFDYSYELLTTFENLKRFSDRFEKKLTKFKEEINIHLSKLRNISLYTNLPYDVMVCSSCKLNTDIYLIQQCSHGICFDCAQEEIYDKRASKGLSTSGTEFKCKKCGFEGSASYLKHRGCGCIINIARYKETFDLPYFWDRINSKEFLWPICKKMQERKAVGTRRYFLHV